MFPSNLHKNILQLDKQISLLENECKNLDVKKRRKSINTKQPRNKCSKILDSCSKFPIQKVELKKSFDSSKKLKKIDAPISRVHSTSSLPSNGSKQCNSNCNGNQCGLYKNSHLCLCQLIVNAKKHLNLENHHTDLSKFNCDEGLILENEKNVKKNFDCVLHREVLFSNPGSTIEVTITKKHNDDNQQENFSVKNSLNVNKSSKCQIESNTVNEQKWSEILRARPLKLKEENYINCKNFDTISKENSTAPIQNCLGLIDNNVINKAVSERHYSTTNIKKQDLHPTSVKLLQSPKQKKSLPNIRSNVEDSVIKNVGNNDFTKIKSSPIQLFQLLVNELEKKTSEECKEKLLNGIKLKENDIAFQRTIMENNNDIFKNSANINDDLFQTIQKLCENLIAEKDMISKELVSKNNMITTMKKREEEYTAVIGGLQKTIEETKNDIPNSISAIKELASLKEKLLEQMKISEVLKKSHIQLKEVLDKCALENDRLKTEIQIFKLESQKHEVLMAGKEAEIKHYKEEIKNFQNQISEHLASLKSNAQAIDLKQMMEAIIQQSQIFTKNDMDSIFMEGGGDFKDSQKHNKLIHSSPTSSKTSDVNSSWKQISSIRGNEPEILLNESNDKDFLKAFIENLSSDSVTAQKFSKEIKKKSSSFTSCVSLNENELENKVSTIVNKQPCKEEKIKLKKNENKINSSSEKIKVSIDELLKGMKMKWSEEVFGASLKNNSIDDFLSVSQMHKSET